MFLTKLFLNSIPVSYQFKHLMYFFFILTPKANRLIVLYSLAISSVFSFSKTIYKVIETLML